MPTTRPFDAILFSLRGCLVDFGARTPVLAMQRLFPQAPLAPGLAEALGRQPSGPELLQYLDLLCTVALEQREPVPGALAVLEQLHGQGIPCAWLDDLPRDASITLATTLPAWLAGFQQQTQRAWPAPDSIWHSLMHLQVDQLQGCVLVSGDPKLLQAGLNAGLWTIGLAVCGPLCGVALGDWHSLDSAQRDQARSQATLRLYRLGVHSVIDQLSDLPACLSDLSLRRGKGEKP